MLRLCFKYMYIHNNTYWVRTLQSLVTESLLDSMTANSLKTDLDELQSLVSCRVAYTRDGPRGALDCLEKLRKDSINPSSSLSSGFRGVINNQKFSKLIANTKKAMMSDGNVDKREPKLIKLKELLSDHFHRHNRLNSSTRVIVFTQLRATVHTIVASLNDLIDEGIRAKEFIGQASTKGTGVGNGNGGPGTEGMGSKGV